MYHLFLVATSDSSLLERSNQDALLSILPRSVASQALPKLLHQRPQRLPGGARRSEQRLESVHWSVLRPASLNDKSLRRFCFKISQNRISSLSSSCRCRIRDLRRIRHIIDDATASIVATSLVHSRLDYCNSF